MRHLKYLATFVMIATAIIAAEHKFPYVARVNGDNVFVRSGSGMNFYRCARISSPDTVKVTGEQFGWAKIEPLKTCYSLIAKEYVEVSKADKNSGTVKANNVNVWSGSPYVSPVHSTTKQLSMNAGAKVSIIGVDGDYYKVTPPTGASYWINAAYIEYVGQLDDYIPQDTEAVATEPKVQKPQTTPKVEPVVDDEIADDTQKATNAVEDSSVAEQQEQETPEVQTEVVVPERVKKQTEAYQKYLQIRQAFNDEKAKPLEVQDYAAIKAAFSAIAADPENGRAVLFAQAQLQEVERCETAKLADQVVRQQDAELARLRSEIKKQYKENTNQLSRTEGYIYSGVLAKSYVYTDQKKNFRYAIKDTAGSIIAYAIPSDAATRHRADMLIGKTVGFSGEIVADRDTSKVIVYFNGISEIWDRQSSQEANASKSDKK